MAAVAESPVTMAAAGDEPPMEGGGGAKSSTSAAAWLDAHDGLSGVAGLCVSAPCTCFG